MYSSKLTLSKSCLSLLQSVGHEETYEEAYRLANEKINQDIIKWIEQNIPNQCFINDRYSIIQKLSGTLVECEIYIIFLNKEAAMAYKLRWF